MKLRVALVILVCVVCMIVESVVPFLAHLKAARPDLLLSVVLYLALNDEIIQGSALSAVAGFFSDLTSATPPFLYTFLAVLTFVVLRTAGAALKTEGGMQSAAVAFGASLVHSLLATMMIGFFTGTGIHLQATPLLWSAFGTALAAPLVFSILRRLDTALAQRDTSAGALR